MQLIDRYIVTRFLGNFFLLFLLLFLFAGGIDIILNLDEFIRAGNTRVGEDGGLLKRAIAIGSMMIDFQGPRLFLFYAYMHGMVAVGAMAFTLAHMYRNKELVAVLASGVSLHRLAMPFLVATCATSVLQLLNQEFMLHRVAPLVLRRHANIGIVSDDALVKFARFQITRNHNTTVIKNSLPGIQTQIRSAILVVRSVAFETGVRQDRANVAGKIDL